MPLIEAHALRKSYRIGRGNIVEALRGVDLSIDAGEMVAIMGPSGCGKSTLMHLLGLLHSPDSGQHPPPRILINGQDVTDLPDRARTRMRAETMGFVFQAFNLVPTLTALENVGLAARYAGRSRSEAAEAARASLEQVGLADRGKHRPTELSGGEQQRVAIARALVNQPALLLADEPTGNLDSATGAEMMDLLRRFNSEKGQTLVIVTHDAEIGSACSRILHMRDGEFSD
jgi:putative ABC transport system ATP-binding protein